MEGLRPNNGRAKIAVIFMLLLLGVTVINAVANYLMYQLYVRFEQGDVDLSDPGTIDTIFALTNLLYLIVYIVNIVVFIMWFRRAYYNLHVIKAPVQFSEGWAAGAWFVPIMNLGRPYLIMTEIWRETQAYLWPEGERQSYKADNTLIGFWWGFFLLWSLVSNVLARLYWDAETIEELKKQALGEVYTGILAVPALILCVMVIRQVSKAEDMLRQHYKRPIDVIDTFVTN